MAEAVARVLIIANKTLGGDEMLERVRQLNTPAGSASFYLLVPATPVGDSYWEAGDYQRRAGAKEAGERLEHGLKLISGLGAEVDGAVGESDPIDAVRAVFDRGLSFDRILLSTFPGGLSRWLRLDVTHRLGRITDLPTDHIEAEETVGSGS